MAIRALTFDNAENIESRNDAYWYSFITKSICGTTVGIIKDGSNMEPHRNGKKIIFDHGYVVIHGRIIEVDKNTEVTIPLPELNQTVSGHVIIRVNLQNEPGNQVFLTTTTVPLIQEDLNTKLLGIYEYELGSYTANNNTIKYTDKRKFINSDYIENDIKVVNTNLEDTKTNLNKEKSRIDSINRNYGIEQNSSYKWTKIEKNNLSDFNINNSQKGLWYIIIYRETTQLDERSKEPIKTVLFNPKYDRIVADYTISSWVNDAGSVKDKIYLQSGTLYIKPWREKVEDADIILTTKTKNIKVTEGKTVVTVYSYSYSWKENELDYILYALYRWDGPGVPVLAGGNLPF